MKGWIFGDPKHKRWTQQLFRHRHGFQNPLHQNYLHLMTLKSLLGLADHQLHSIVYFIGDCTFKTPCRRTSCVADWSAISRVRALPS